MTALNTMVLSMYFGVQELLRQPAEHGRDRGDVPGWVMVVVMTAALVLAILIPFRQAIVEAVQNALDSVTGTSP